MFKFLSCLKSSRNEKLSLQTSVGFSSLPVHQKTNERINPTTAFAELSHQEVVLLVGKQCWLNGVQDNVLQLDNFLLKTERKNYFVHYIAEGFIKAKIGDPVGLQVTIGLKDGMFQLVTAHKDKQIIVVSMEKGFWPWSPYRFIRNNSDSTEQQKKEIDEKEQKETDKKKILYSITSSQQAK